MTRLNSRRMSSTSPNSFKSLLCRSGGAATYESSPLAQPNSPQKAGARVSPLTVEKECAKEES
jgi:hypothetical protein